MSELKVHIELTRFVQPEKIEIDANERAVNEKSQYCFFVCTTFDSFLNDLQSYKPTYLPDGAELKNTVEQPEMLAYEYAINESSYFNILLSKSDTRIYADAENTEIESFDKDGVIGYYFKKDDLNYICYERDGDFFSIYGSIDMDELIKIAAGITTE
ncbi:MAG: DUF4367 domain-containing protein [Anaerobutyricum hallii]|uniref:DUF4367 domain-containing protein n=1 Tax=Anaerobutyricum hallii TaxID=39488 RepID=UPI003996C868